MLHLLIEWKNDILRHKRELILALFFLGMALILDRFARNYTAVKGIARPTDFLLDHIPVMKVDFLVVWIYLLVWVVFVVYALIIDAKRAHYYIGMLSLFVLARAGFSILTHMASPAEAIYTTYRPMLYQLFSFPNALFFCAKAGIPFLVFLMVPNKKIKIFMLCSSVLLAILVILMHLHYSIDIVSAYFITFGIYKLGGHLFYGK